MGDQGPSGSGPLAGVRVVELTGLGPAPFGAMLLADMGADVITVDRVGEVTGADPADYGAFVFRRGRRSIGVDLKHPEGVEVVRRLTDGADVFLEGFRPGVAERLGIGPDELRGRNPRLVYGRMTGWGQDGPWSNRVGHDINYIALAGPLAHIGRAGQRPTPPLNLLGDFGGGGLLLAFGVACALAERAVSGQGQVVDAAMVDGAAIISAPMAVAYAGGWLHAERGTNWVDSGAHYYEVYECADGEHLSIGAIEPQFYARLLEVLEIDGGPDGGPLPDQEDEAAWPAMKELVASVVRTRTQAEWMERFGDDDQCVAPVLRYGQVRDHPHIVARGTYVERDGVLQPSPAPRFDRTPAVLPGKPSAPGQHTDAVLAAAGFTVEEVATLREAGAVA